MISQKVLKIIKEKNIKPKPRWQFLLKNYLVWFLAALALIIGSFAFAVIIYMFLNNDWDVYQKINHSLFKFMLITLPYAWLLFLGMFVFIAYYNVKHTKKGYRFSLTKLIIGSVVISMLLGLLFYGFGLGRAIDEKLMERMLFYRRVFNPRMMIWDKPEQGRLMGEVLEVIDPYHFKIIDFNRKSWNVIRELVDPELELQMRVRLLGRMIDEQNFKAFQVMPAPHHGPPPPNFRPMPFRFNN